MNKKIKHGLHYIFAILIIVFSGIGIGFTAKPIEKTDYINQDYWFGGSSLTKHFEQGDEVHFYFDDDRIDHFTEFNDSLVLFVDDDNNTLYTINIIAPSSSNITFTSNLGNDDFEYEEYSRVLTITFEEGTYMIDFEVNTSYASDAPMLSIIGDPVIRVIDYTDYFMIPILTGVVGLFYLIMIRINNHDSYDVHYHSSNPHKKRKREKY